MNSPPRFTGDQRLDPHLNLTPASPRNGGVPNNSKEGDGGACARKFERLHPSRKSPLVLVVDDDYRLTNSVSKLLREEGFDVFSAYDGDVGLALAIVKHPDLMVLDSRMPQRSGYLVLEHMRTQEDLLTPVIMLSENEGDRHREYAEMLGVIEYLKKPIDANKLVGTITHCFQTS